MTDIFFTFKVLTLSVVSLYRSFLLYNNADFPAIQLGLSICLSVGFCVVPYLPIATVLWIVCPWYCSSQSIKKMRLRARF